MVEDSYTYRDEQRERGPEDWGQLGEGHGGRAFFEPAALPVGVCRGVWVWGALSCESCVIDELLIGFAHTLTNGTGKTK